MLASDFVVLAAACTYFFAVLPFCPALATRDQVAALFVNAAPLLVLALGQTIVLLVGGIDLSLSGLISLAGVAGALVMADDYGKLAGSSGAILAGVGLMILIGIVVGALHGVAVAWLEMPAFLVTLSSMMSLGGAAVWLTGSKRLSRLPLPLLDTVQGDWLGVPVMVWIASALALLMHILLARTIVGRQLMAVGQNVRASRVSGLAIGRVTVFAFTASGFCTAVAAVLYTARAETASPTFAREILLDAIGAAVIGGTSLSGGRASALGTVFGTLLMTLIGNILTLLNLDYWHILMAKGGALFAAGYADSLRRVSLGEETRS
jgi:ribose transport system permease protein